MAEAFGRYWLHEKLGQGGMAEVYRATIGPDSQTYAFDLVVKLLRSELAEDPEQVEMFFTEAEVARFLNHPNVVQVYESGHVGGVAYIAMEYIWGYDLETLVHKLRRRRLRLTPELTVHIALQVLRALDYVHQATDPRGQPMDIVHRDVTPSNIYVTLRGEVKLGDFGVAIIRAQDLRDNAGVLRGKLTYMPPEVLAGRPIDHYVDLWSLAATVYELLTGRQLYDENVEEADLLGGLIQPSVVPAHKCNAEIDPALSRILGRALSLKRRNRPADATIFYRQLKLYLLSQGIQVDPNALGRFVRAAGGGEDPGTLEPRADAQARAGAFGTPEYQAPVEFSPTQRYELIRRRRLWQRGPLIALGAAAIGVAAGVWVARRPAALPAAPQAQAPQPLAAPQAQPAPQPAAQPSPPPVGARAHGGIDEETWGGEIDLSDDVASDGGDRRAPASFRSLISRGRAQTKRGRFGAAAEAYKRALELRPQHVVATLGRARALYELGDYDQASQLAQRVIKQAPDNARAFFLLGSVLRSKGDSDGARQAFERCVKLDLNGQLGRTARQILNAW